MPRKTKALVLDSWSILAYLEDEPAAQKVADLIADAHEKEILVLMSVINVGEAWYIIAREISEAEADKSIAEIKQLGIEFVDADWERVLIAARFKARERISYADCFAAALAKANKAELVTGDKEFRQVEGEIKIRWL